MTLSNFLLTLKGGAGSGNHGHSGRPGKRGGSSSQGLSSILQSGLSKYATNDHRKALISAIEGDTQKMLDYYNFEPKDIQGVTIHGSFISNKPYPNDIDVLIKVPESYKIKAGGGMDQSWLHIGDQKVNFWIAKPDLYKILQNRLSEGIEGHTQGTKILEL